MVTPEQLVQDILRGLEMGPPPAAVIGRLQSAPLQTDDPQGLLVLIRTTPPLTAKIMGSYSAWYPLEMLEALLPSFFGLMTHYIREEVVLDYNELLLGVVSGMQRLEGYGLTPDPEKGTLYIPRIDIPSLRKAMNQKLSDSTGIARRLGPWGIILSAAAWRRNTSDRGIAVQYMFVPDLPDEELTDDHIDRAVRISLGWNLSGLLRPGEMRSEIENLKRAIAEAVTFKTF
ncbi:MAG TPA: hypothetical protein VJM32_02735 [Candidatus Saccharimonadales bacterium]|nr:hypothetical protein [Candidatus Saccharimonadales bacterium]